MTDEEIDRLMDTWHDHVRLRAFHPVDLPFLQPLYEAAMVDDHVLAVCFRAHQERIAWGLSIVLHILRRRGLVIEAPAEIKGRLKPLCAFTEQLVRERGIEPLPLRTIDQLQLRTLAWLEEAGAQGRVGWDHVAFMALVNLVKPYGDIPRVQTQVNELEVLGHGPFPTTQGLLLRLQAHLDTL